jgi:hypothetical protein
MSGQYYKGRLCDFSGTNDGLMQNSLGIWSCVKNPNKPYSGEATYLENGVKKVVSFKDGALLESNAVAAPGAAAARSRSRRQRRGRSQRRQRSQRQRRGRSQRKH